MPDYEAALEWRIRLHELRAKVRFREVNGPLWDIGWEAYEAQFHWSVPWLH